MNDVVESASDSGTAALTPAFFDWWYAPWDYAAQSEHGPISADADLLARRDGYRLWCDAARVMADFPPSFDPLWSIAATDDAGQFATSLALFAGVIAAREHNNRILDQLGFADRKWCISLASTQPLRRAGKSESDDGESIELQGAVELAVRLQSGFRGLWSRLRLLLTPQQAEQIGKLLPHANTLAAGVGVARAQRCWRMCSGRARSASPATGSALAYRRS